MGPLAVPDPEGDQLNDPSGGAMISLENSSASDPTSPGIQSSERKVISTCAYFVTDHSPHAGGPVNKPCLTKLKPLLPDPGAVPYPPSSAATTRYLSAV